jgi:sulfatase modifying factor 1
MGPKRAIAAMVAAAALAGCNILLGITPGQGTGGAGGSASTSGTSGTSGKSSTGATHASGSSASGASSSGTTTSTGGAPGSSTLIPAGTFGFLDEQDQVSTPMTISHDFYLDDLEISVGRFKAWVSAGQPLPCATGTCSLDPGGPYEQKMVWDASWNSIAMTDAYQSGCNDASGTSISTPTFTQPGGDALPMNCLDWYHAAAFCAWEGKRLPTETEWQYVATGRTLARTYPWGSQDPTDCTLALWNLGAADANGCHFPKPGGSAPAGASRDGILDMAGSVWEWVWDYDGAYPTTSHTDYAGPTTPAYRADRGGSWAFDSGHLRATYRDATPPDSAFADVGARCAKTKH